ncbi:hypothetical protein SAMN06269185_3315 [Natronoarchaeum philippinense]|uniref:Uncharacterized protein n=1 Tax=Natronoarchaeum philippinense TaxID=558529 RepID=A0A285P948_NATPI|nr:hypothetical protein [Natronoarchaeum philippinense]SNZ18270.1 hypothetical protein SAMN06269185_3315 [Natronoarchaeum philippinense]
MASNRRAHPGAVDGVLGHAGVGDQDTTCPNGNEGCPGPNNPTGELPWSVCFLNGGDA